MQSTLVILVVGLTPSLLGEHTPNLRRLAIGGGLRPLATVTPAVTCTAQSTLLTGLLPREHGAVANGWYFRDLAEVWLWRQSNRLIAGEKIWEAAKRRDPGFTCAQMFWWYNMYWLGRLERHAAADVPGRRPQDPGPLRLPGGVARRARRPVRPLPAVQVLGTGGRHHLQPMDRARDRACPPDPQAHPHALLPAAPRLQPATPRPRPRPAAPAAGPRGGRRARRRADRRCRA